MSPMDMKAWTNQESTQPISSARGEMKVGYRSLCYRASDYPGFIWNSGAAASFLYRNTNRRFSFAGWFTKDRVQGHASARLCHAIVCLVSVANPANENLRFFNGSLYTSEVNVRSPFRGAATRREGSSQDVWLGPQQATMPTSTTCLIGLVMGATTCYSLQAKV